ncbi:ice-binding family protein [bacterium]|nr:ice-binding family protein [bacterium]
MWYKHYVKYLSFMNKKLTLRGFAFFVLLLTTLAPASIAGEAPVDLRSAGNFAALAGTTLTNVVSVGTTVTGDIGISPGTELTGFPPGILVGTLHVGDVPASLAQADLSTAYNDAAGRSTAPIGISGNLGGMTLFPGLYKSTSSLEISSGDLTLDAQGDPTAVFIFQMASTFTVSTGRKMILSGGANAANIFWQVGSSATFGTGSVIKGTILSAVSISFNTGASLDGRALAKAAVTLDSNIITKPLPVELPTPTSMPAATPVAPTSTSTSTPTQIPDLPTATPELPTVTPNASTSTPTQSPVLPTMTPELPTVTPIGPTSTPTQTPVSPTTTPGSPTVTPPGITLSVDRTEIKVGVVLKEEMQVEASSQLGNNLSIVLDPPDLLTLVSSHSQSGLFFGQYSITGTESLIGEHSLTITVSSAVSVTEIHEVSKVIKITVADVSFDDLLVIQGYGGTTTANLRNLDSRRDETTDGEVNFDDLTAIKASWDALPKIFTDIVGGGRNREVFAAIGDVNNDNVDDVITTFGPITEIANQNSASMFIVRNASGLVILPPDGGVFPTNKSGEPINNPNGAISAAVGNFLGLPGNKQIAFAQGWGGNGVIRIVQYTGVSDFSNPRNSWRIVGQLYGTQNSDLNINSGLALSDEFSEAWSQNANGGITLAAGDLDGDGLDELVVGQTNSPTSRGVIQVLDFGAPNPLVDNVVFDANYFEYNVFDKLPSVFAGLRGNGGVNLAVADITGDGHPEVILTSQGNSRNFGDERDGASPNPIIILQPVVSNGRVVDFNVPSGGIQGAFNQFDPLNNPETVGALNPSSALSVGVGEFSGFADDGKEIVVGTQAIIEYDGFSASISRRPPDSRYSILYFEQNSEGSISASSLILDNFADGFRAFSGNYEPSSASISAQGISQ